MWTLKKIILIAFLVVASTGLSKAQGRGGYDQFGQYVDGFTIDAEKSRLAEQKRLAGKLTEYDKKLKRNPKNSMLYFLQGNLYMELARPHDAIRAYRSHLALKPKNGEAHYNLAKAYDAVREGEKALEQAKQADKVFRENLYIHWQTLTQELIRLLQKQYNIR